MSVPPFCEVVEFYYRWFLLIVLIAYSSYYYLPFSCDVCSTYDEGDEASELIPCFGLMTFLWSRNGLEQGN